MLEMSNNFMTLSKLKTFYFVEQQVQRYFFLHNNLSRTNLRCARFFNLKKFLFNYVLSSINIQTHLAIQIVNLKFFSIFPLQTEVHILCHAFVFNANHHHQWKRKDKQLDKSSQKPVHMNGLVDCIFRKSLI